MDVVAVVLCAVGGLAFVGRGLHVLLRGGPLVVKSTGRVWRTAGRAGSFWLLLGSALLVGGLLRVGARAGFIGADAGFWISLVPAGLACLAVIGFWPRKR
jgi:hypothetical protein